MKKIFAFFTCLVALIAIGVSLAQPTSNRTRIDLRTGPIINSSDVANLALVLSVEFPTVGSAYRSGSYVTSQKYLGYFNSNSCYSYVGTSTNGYYQPNSATNASYLCNVTGAGTGFSGNFLNFAATSSIDIVRFALTGGDRIVDSKNAGTAVNISIASPGVITLAAHGLSNGDLVQLNTTGSLPTGLVNCGIYYVTGKTTNDFRLSETPGGTNVNTSGAQSGIHSMGVNGISTCAQSILQRAVLPGGADINGSFYGSGANFPTRTLPMGTLTAALTPFGAATQVKVKSCYDNIFFGSVDKGSCTAPLNNANLSTTNTAGATVTGTFKARVAVCGISEGPVRTDLCKQYPSGNYKPIGEIQKNADKVRVAAFGYLLDQVNTRYGGVLRAPMKFAGINQKNASGIVSANPEPEWDATTGAFFSKPINTANESGYPYSGVVNYLNTFGRDRGIYKRFDPVGELYYESVRYYQGLQPTPSAISGTDTANMNAYPIYTTWADPMQSTCQRNYALVVGDNNTHLDAQIPGSTVASQTRAVLGSGVGALDADYWTRRIESFETNGTATYTDSQNRLQYANGNAASGATGVQSGNTSLATKSTGSDRASYLWAGVAYWANTQPIRADKPLARVRTFVIDVDEGGNGTLQRDRSFYLAGKYGGFADVGLDQSYATGDGNPFKTFVSGTATASPIEWLATDGSTSPSGYFLASQPERMILAIKKIFAEASKPSGNLAGGSLSVSRLSKAKQSGAFYQAQIDAANWSGTVIRTELTFNTTTQQLDANPTPVWDAAKILTGDNTGTTTVAPFPIPANRNIVSYSSLSSSLSGVNFDWSSIDQAVRDSLKTDPATNIMQGDPDGQDRLNYIRGVRTGETNGVSNYRSRTVIMGDSINSAPFLKGAASADIPDASYRPFYTANSSRTPTVYIGSNDGMLHAFSAAESKTEVTNGRELFAYIPRAVSTKLNKLTDPAYVKEAYVDGAMSVNEAQIYRGGSVAWGTALVSSMGGGAKGLFALDVSSPSTFTASNVLWEFTDADDADMGNLVAEPKIVKLAVAGSSNATPNYKWFAMVTSGYNNYTTGGSSDKQALFLLSLEKAPGQPWALGTNYFKMYADNGTFAATSTAATGMGMPGIATGPQGNVLYAYAGDLQGNLWKFDLSGASSTWSTTANASVLFIAKDPTNSALTQPITVVPAVSINVLSGYQIGFGTGKFLEPSDGLLASAQQQTLYGIWDSNDGKTFQRIATTTPSVNGLISRTLTVSGGTATASITGAPFSYGTSTGSYRGWFADLSTTLERVAVDPVIDSGLMAVNSTIPAGDPCSTTGGSNQYRYNPSTGITFASVAKSSVPSYLGTPSLLEVGDTAWSSRSNSGRYVVTKKINSISPGVGGGVSTTESTVTSIAGRISWREITNFQ